MGMTELRAKYKNALRALKNYKASWIKSQHNGIYFRDGEWHSNDFNTYAGDIVISSYLLETKQDAINYLTRIIEHEISETRTGNDKD